MPFWQIFGGGVKVRGPVQLGSGAGLISKAGAPTDGTSGDGAGSASPGSVYLDTTNGHVYQNMGTRAAPRWKMISGVAVKQVTDAQIKALLGTDIELVAAPGASKAVIVEQVYAYFDVTTTAYTIGTAALAVGYADDGGDIFAITEAGWLDTVADAARQYLPTSPVIPTANKGVVLRAATADVTGGNAANTLSLLVFYRVVPAAAFSA